jgi:hypothetical protein
MKSLSRTAAAAVLAVFVASGLAVVAPAAAADTGPQAAATATHITIGEVCGRLSDYIAFLEARPPSRLRDFLLTQAKNLYSRFCE